MYFNSSRCQEVQYLQWAPTHKFRGGYKHAVHSTPLGQTQNPVSKGTQETLPVIQGRTQAGQEVALTANRKMTGKRFLPSQLKEPRNSQYTSLPSRSLH